MEFELVVSLVLWVLPKNIENHMKQMEEGQNQNNLTVHNLQNNHSYYHMCFIALIIGLGGVCNRIVGC